MSVYTAGRLFLLFSFVLVLLGGIWLHRALFGRLSAWPLLAALFLFGYVLHLGFVNYLFGISLVVPAFALWVQSERWDWRARLAASAVAALAVYFCHYFAFIAYGLCVAGYEAGRVWSIRPFSWRATLLRAAAAGAQAVMPMALQAGAAGNGLGAVTSYGTLAERILGLLSPAMFPGSRADLAIMALAALGLVLGLVTHRVALAPAMRGPLLLLALAAVAIPAIVSATWGMQFRLPMLFTWLLAASIEVRVSGWRVVSVVAAAMLLFVSHIATIALSWRARGAQYDELRAALPLIERGARLLPFRVDRGSNGAVERGPFFTWSQMPAMAVIERDVFLPFLHKQAMMTVQAASRTAAISTSSLSEWSN